VQVVDVALVGELLELAEEVALVRDDLLLGGLVVLEVVVELVRVGDVVDLHGALVELLVRHHVEGERGDRRVGVLLALRQEGDEVADELLELSQVERHVVLVELGALVVLHVRGHRELESRLVAELLAHLLDELLDLRHLVLDVADLVQLRVVDDLRLRDLLHEALAHVALLGVGHGLQFLVVVDLFADLPIGSLNRVNIRVQHVHVVEK